jgi:hypothetical protein
MIRDSLHTLVLALFSGGGEAPGMMMKGWTAIFEMKAQSIARRSIRPKHIRSQRVAFAEHVFVNEGPRSLNAARRSGKESPGMARAFRVAAALGQMRSG